MGGWPVVLAGSAEVTTSAPGRELALHGRTPFGGVDVRVRIDDTATGCVLEITEDVVSGLGRLVPARVRAGVIGARNVETQRRLALVAQTGTP
jgi:hypothetical protein